MDIRKYNFVCMRKFHFNVLNHRIKYLCFFKGSFYWAASVLNSSAIEHKPQNTLPAHYLPNPAPLSNY